MEDTSTLIDLTFNRRPHRAPHLCVKQTRNTYPCAMGTGCEEPDKYTKEPRTFLFTRKCCGKFCVVCGGKVT